jgi:hypothetical protein
LQVELADSRDIRSTSQFSPGWARGMKILTALALLVVANVGLLLWGEAPLVWTSTASDQWNRSCRYYYPLRTFELVVPLSQNCPHWTEPR